MKRIGRDWDELPLARCRLTCHSVATEEACARRRTTILYRRRAHAPSRASCRHDGARGGVVRPPLRTDVEGAFLLGYFLARRSADFDTPWLLVYLFTARHVLVRGPLAGGVVRRASRTARPDQTRRVSRLAQTVNACPDHVAPTARESIETRPPRDASGNRRRAPRCAFCGRVGRGYKCGLPHAATDL